MIAYWVEQGLVLADQFREGNVPAGMGNAEFVEYALGMLPEGVVKVYMRADSALYDHKTLRLCDRRGVEFAVSADMTGQLRQEIGKLPASAWKPLKNRNGTAGEMGRMWAEVPYVPDDPVAKKGERPFRYLAIRLPLKRVQHDLFEPKPEHEYVAIVTNREGPGDELIHWHREKCGTVEHAHDRIKNDVGGRLFPSRRFGANAAWYRLAIIALNLQRAMQVVGLPEQWREHRPQTLRYRLWNRGGRVVRHARRLVVLVSQMAASLLPVYVGVRVAMAAVHLLC